MINFGLPQQKLTMSKSTFFTGQPIFNQILTLLPQESVRSLTAKYQTDRYTKRFNTHAHLVTMLYAAFHRCGSLREVITGMQANSSRLLHLGITYTPRRSTLADANKRIDSRFYADLYQALFNKYYSDLPDSRLNKKDRDRLFIIDSTTITLFSDVMKGVGLPNANGKRKGGVKAHTIIDAKHDVPCYAWLSEAKASDREFLSKINFLPPGSIVVMDKGYNSYQKYADWTNNSITWVTRLNERAVWEIVSEKWVSYYRKCNGVLSDFIIELGRSDLGHDKAMKRVRMVKFYDKKNNRPFTFISNDLKCSPLRIAQLYKDRWQIESLFKRLKSNFQFRYFLGDNENAIKTQIWCALIADLLIKVIQKKVQQISLKVWSFSNIAALIRQHLTTYVDIIKFLSNPEAALINYKPPEEHFQLKLFAIKR